MLQFSFMRRALLAGFLLSMVISSIGVIMVNRKTSMVADAISHTSLTGVGLGLIFGFDPIFGAVDDATRGGCFALFLTHSCRSIVK